MKSLFDEVELPDDSQRTSVIVCSGREASPWRESDASWTQRTSPDWTAPIRTTRERSVTPGFGRADNVLPSVFVGRGVDRVLPQWPGAFVSRNVDKRPFKVNRSPLCDMK